MSPPPSHDRHALSHARRINDQPITVVHGVEHDLLVPRVGHGAAHGDAVRAAIELAVPAARRSDLVVDRSGTRLWGAAAGGDLLDGDRIVEPAARRLPMLVGVSGSLAGALHPMRSTHRLQRGGPFGGRVIDDPDVSRTHLAVDVLDRATQVRDLDSRNGTLVNGVRVDGPVTLHAGDRIVLGSSELIVASDSPPKVGRLVERGRVFIRPERAPLDAPWRSLPEVVADGLGASGRLWSLVPGHPDYLVVPGVVGSDGRSVWVALGRDRVVGLVGVDDALVAAAVAAWLARILVLHGPSRFRLQVDAAALDGMLEDIARFARWFPHHRWHPPFRPAWQHLPTLHVTEFGAAPTVRLHRGDVRIMVARDRRQLPVGTEVLLDLTAGPPAEVLDPAILEVVARALAPVLPTIPVAPFPIPTTDGEPSAV